MLAISFILVVILLAGITLFSFIKPVSRQRLEEITGSLIDDIECFEEGDCQNDNY